jgi:hypothetical protein
MLGVLMVRVFPCGYFIRSIQTLRNYFGLHPACMCSFALTYDPGRCKRLIFCLSLSPRAIPSLNGIHRDSFDVGPTDMQS